MPVTALSSSGALPGHGARLGSYQGSWTGRWQDGGKPAPARVESLLQVGVQTSLSKLSRYEAQAQGGAGAADAGRPGWRSWTGPPGFRPPARTAGRRPRGRLLAAGLLRQPAEKAPLPRPAPA